MKQLIILILIISSFGLSAETKTFSTVTDALNYDGADRENITHLIITDSIVGSDYNEGSEWRELRTLNLAYPSLSEITIYTDQDIPSSMQKIENGMWNTYTLFFFSTWNMTDDPVVFYPSLWLKGFYAPNIAKIGGFAFMVCENLTTVNFSSVIWIENCVFYFCKSLISICLPVIQTIESEVFIGCESLTTVSLGSELTNPTTIIPWGLEAFGTSPSVHLIQTENINLILGENVLPLPDTNTNIWESNKMGKSYIWKSITIKKVGINEVIKNANVSISPNPTTDFVTVSFELEKNCNLEIILYDGLGNQIKNIYDGFADAGVFLQTVKVSQFPKGIYYLQISDGKFSTVEKIVVN